MSRQRSRDKCIPITIALPTSLAMKLENALSHSQSRSTWVANAIENKILDIKHNPVDDRTTRQLIAQLSMRQDIDESLRLILKTHLK
jgi:metal-responsive CopG/Arc/MetJ family transcriptional regulator